MTQLLMMKPRHAAALALVMWVLAVPAKGHDLSSGGYWLAKFDTQDQCEERRTEVRKPDFKSPNVPLNADFAKATCAAYATPDLCLSCGRARK
jgi:hypothetical protein